MNLSWVANPTSDQDGMLTIGWASEYYSEGGDVVIIKKTLRG